MLRRIPYNPDELKSVGTYPPMMPGFPPSSKYNYPIAPKDNYLAVYQKGDKPLWIPLGGDTRIWTPRIDADNIARAFVIEANPLSQEEIDKLAVDGYKDKFGVTWIYVPVATGSMVKPGKPILTDANDWEKIIKMPDVASWDWAGAKAASEAALKNEDRLLIPAILTGFFERLISFMDFDGAAVAIVDEDQKDAVKALFNRLADVYIEMIKKYKELWNPGAINFHDDWGHQYNPFFSLATAREMIVPALTRIANAIHDNGMFMDMHSCGKNELLVPAYIEAGCDSWSGQPMNDKAMLYEKYGDKILLGIDPDITFTPETSAEDAKASAKRFVAKFGPSFEKKPFLCSAFMTPPAFNETLYEESRKMLG